MPPQKVTTTLAKKLGAKLATSHAEVAGNERKPDNGGEMPADISNGIAKLTSMKIGEYKDGKNKGQPFFMASGIAVEIPQPELKWAVGLRTQIGPIPLCDTEAQDPQYNKSFADHWNEVLDILRGFGIDTNEMDVTTDGAVEQTLEALQSAGLYFRFRTWKAKKRAKGDPRYKEQYDGPNAPDPRTNHVWGLACEYAPPEDAGGVDDETPPTPVPVAKPAPKAAAPAAKPAAPAKAPAKKPAPPPPVEVAPEYTDDQDIDSLLAAANDESDETAQANAQQALKDQAMSLGHDEATCDACPTWEALVAIIKGEGAAEAFAVGEHYYYCPPDPKTKKPGKKVQCEVIAVDADKGTVDLQNGTNPKVKYKAVSTDKLTGE